MKKKIYFRYILPLLIALGVFSSCSEGLFNFTEETGNISIGFFADSSVGNELDKIVINLSNSETGDTLKKECEIKYSGSGQRADCYISRADTGPWRMQTTVYDVGGNITAERSDDFKLDLGQTVIADFNLYSGGILNLDWKAPVGGELVSLLNMERLDVMINLYHYSGIGLTDAERSVFLIAMGSNFDTALSSLRVQFPDNGYFEYDGGFSRNINDIGIEANPTILSINRAGYTAKGNYSLAVSDSNGVETTLSDYCSFNFEPESGLASFVTAPVYAGGLTLNETTDYDINGSANAGCYLVYCVDDSLGTNIGGTPKVNPPGAVTLDMSGVLSAPDNGYIIIVTLDAALSQTDIDGKYVATETSLLPEEIPGWLYLSFGDRINFAGISVFGPIAFP